MKRIVTSFLPAMTLLLPLAWSSEAHAGIGACGDIHVEAEASCEVKGGVECTGSCTPISFEAQCAAELTASCGGSCNAEIDVECSGSCEASCMGTCEANPGSFDCRGECVGDCSGGCEGRCEAGEGRGECLASCEATCEGSCSASCEATPPTVDCAGQCEASCSGRCDAEANVDCQIDCQANGYVDCQADLQGGCEAECDVEQGALFCDGQYVDHGNNLEECVESLRAVLNIQVEGYAEAECSGNECSAAAGGSISCNVAEPDERGRDLALMGAFGLMVVGFATRRRR